MITRFFKHWVKWFSVALLLIASVAMLGFTVCWVVYPFPEDRLTLWSQSPVITDRTGGVLLEVTGVDGQWRREITLEQMSPFLIDATLAVEDARFYQHGGVDARAVARAAWQNITHGEVISGASTLTMQVCRMMDGRSRTFSAKAIETFRAVQLESLRSKDEILALYLNMAPYGGNIRGVEAASLAYFGKPAARLSLGQAALLAGLPQSPERFRLDRFPELAQARRAAVLERMHAAGMITADQLASACDEPITLNPAGHTDPDALHAAWMAMGQRPQGGQTTIDPRIQRLASEVVADHAKDLPQGTDIAVVVLDIATGELLALVGSADPTDPVDGQVNGALARRSPGSALKPFIYAAAMEANQLNRDTLVPDRPIRREGWEPGNFDRQFDGEVSAGDALRRSLNIPAILVGEQVGVSRCVGVLNASGCVLPKGSGERGGLTLAVGGVEVTLLDLTNAYATLGRGGVYRPVRFWMDEPVMPSRVALKPETAASINDILSNQRRAPNSNRLDTHVSDACDGWFMWKTGTSAARRDALAVGHNQRFAVGVWAGRFSGGGDFRYTGRASSEPILVELLTHPALVQTQLPKPARQIAVHRPMVFPDQPIDTVHIHHPADGARFVAWDGQIELTAQAKGGPASWFLNGKLVASSRPPRLELGLGRHELTCIGPDRERHTVRFEVIHPD